MKTTHSRSLRAAVIALSAVAISSCGGDKKNYYSTVEPTTPTYTASFNADFDGDGLKAFPFGPDMDDDNDGFLSRHASGNDVDDQNPDITKTGKGNGLFSAPDFFWGTEDDPEFTGYADFNSDGWLDPFVLESSIQAIGVQINEGNKQINTGIHYGVGSDFDDKYPAVCDLNEDGNLDAVLVGTNIKIVWGNGDGYFTHDTDITTFGSGAAITKVLCADFDGDGHLDLAAADNTLDQVIVAFNDGLGAFSAPATLSMAATANTTRGMALGDVNNDKRLDLVVLRQNGSAAGGVSTFINNGNRTFATEATTDLALATDNGNDIALGDFNEDGKLDIIGDHESDTSQLTFAIGDGDGTFSSQSAIELKTSNFNPQFISNITDLNGDGHLDVIATEDGDEQMAILKGKGDGTFIIGVLDIGYDVEVTAAAVEDFNGDGIFDIAVHSDETSEPQAGLYVLWGRADPVVEEEK